MSKYNIKLSLEGFDPPKKEKDIPVPETFMMLLSSMNLTKFIGNIEMTSSSMDYRRFQEAIKKALEESKKKIALVIFKKTNIKIDPSRIQIRVINVDEIVQEDVDDGIPF